MKKMLGFGLSLVLVLVIFVGASFTASAESGSKLNFILNEDGTSYSVISCSAIEPTMVIPSSYNALPVTSIGNSVFYDFDTLTEIIIPDTITSIGNTAFYGCDNLSAVVIPDSVINIGGFAFAGCGDLTITASCNSCAVEYAAAEGIPLDLQHQFKEEGKIESEPTYKTEGIMAYECYNCDIERYEPISKLIPPTIEIVGDELVCFSGDNILEAYTGLAMRDGSYVYLENSVIKNDYIGLAFYCDEWYYWECDSINQDYTGLVYYCNVWFYVENGILNWNYTGLAEYEGNYFYIEDGILNWGYTGLVSYCGEWFYVTNGILDSNYTGLTEYYGTWFYVENGYLNWNKTTLAYAFDNWFYIENGILNWSYTGLAGYEGNYFYIEGGILNWGYTGLVEYYGAWFYVENGVLNWNYTSLVAYCGTWFYVENGMLNWNYTGITYYNGVWYYVENGILNCNRETLAYAYDTWFYIENGCINWNGNTVVYYYGTWYYVNDGCLDWNYNGIWYEYGVLYYIQNGIVTYIQKPETKEEVLAFYQNAVANVAVGGNAGYSYKSWEEVTKAEVLDSNLPSSVTNIFKDMTFTEEEAEKYNYSIGSVDARENIALSNCSANSVQSATIEEKGGNYIITIVMKDQVNPQKTDADGISVMSTNIVYADDLETSFDDMAIIRNADCSYSNYTIVAEVTKYGELVSVKHSSNVDVYADVVTSFSKMSIVLGMNVYEEYSDFTY